MVTSFYYQNVLFVSHMNDKLIMRFKIKLLAKFEKNCHWHVTESKGWITMSRTNFMLVK
jgi:hypothetical protein